MLNPSLDGGLQNSNFNKSTRINSTQRYLKRYIRMNKLVGNISDEYAIMLLREKGIWWKSFTKDERDFCSYIDELSELVNETVYNSFAIDSIIEAINAQIDVAHSSEFVQAIVIYGRTLTVPHVSSNAPGFCETRDLINFTLDVLFLHDVHVKTQQVYDAWGNIDSVQVPGWYYEIGKVMGQDKMSLALSQLLAHPSQRGDQSLV